MNTSQPEALRPIDQALADFLQRRFPGISEAHASLAALVSHALADGSPCLPLEQLPRHAMEIGLAAPPPVEGNPLLSSDGSTPLVLDHQRLYLRRYWQMECDIATALRARLHAPEPATSNIRDALDRLFPPAAAPASMPDWARAAAALATRARITIITGGPGTGKTTAVVRLLALLQQAALQAGGEPLTIHLAAPTGKAAARLGESIRASLQQDATPPLDIDPAVRASLPTEVRTLHRLLGTQQRSRHFRHGRGNPLLADVVVVDEASMISMELMHALLAALPDATRLILVGDKDQLASVEPGNVMSALCAGADEPAYDAATRAFLNACGCTAASDAAAPARNDGGSNALTQQTVRLRHNWRAKDAPGIVALAAAVNANDTTACEHAWQQHPEALQRLPATRDWLQQHVVEGATGLRQLLHTVAAGPAADESADAWAQRLHARLRKQQLLTPLRHGPHGLHEINAQLDALLRSPGQPRGPYAGQALLVTSNLYDLKLMNGDVGLVLPDPADGRLRVAFESSDPHQPIRWLLPEQIAGHSQGAWALSVHQSQGSEYGRVLLALPPEDSPVLTRELLYTAITRASRQFVLIEQQAGTASSLLRLMVERRTERASGLQERLAELLGQLEWDASFDPKAERSRK